MNLFIWWNCGIFVHSYLEYYEILLRGLNYNFLLTMADAYVQCDLFI